MHCIERLGQTVCPCQAEGQWSLGIDQVLELELVSLCIMHCFNKLIVSSLLIASYLCNNFYDHAFVMRHACDVSALTFMLCDKCVV